MHAETVFPRENYPSATTPQLSVRAAAARIVDERHQRVHALLALLAEGAQRGDHRATAALLHDFVVGCARDQDLALVDVLLRDIDPARLTTFELTSCLIATRPAADRLPARGALRRITEQLLVSEVGAAEATRTLRFL